MNENALTDVSGTSLAKQGLKLWFNGHAFAEHILSGGQPLLWEKPTEFASQYRSLQGILGAERLSIPLMGFLDSWVQRNPHVLQIMTGKSRVRYAIKKCLTYDALRNDMKELLSAVCSLVDAEIMLELPSNSALITWAHALANPDSTTENLSDIDIDSTSVYLADTVRQLKNVGLAGIVCTVSRPDIEAGADFELYKPIANVAENYRWSFAFRRIFNDSKTFNSGPYSCLGGVNGTNIATLNADFWSGKIGSIPEASCLYSELPTFVEPELVRGRIAEMRAGVR